MQETDPKNRRPGRPKTNNPANARLPVVRITPVKLDVYRQAAQDRGVSISEWVRVSLDAALHENHDTFMEKRRESRINSLEIGQYYQFKIPGNYKTLGKVQLIEGDFVEIIRHKAGTVVDQNNSDMGARTHRVHKNQIIDVVPASKQMLESKSEPRIIVMNTP